MDREQPAGVTDREIAEVWGTSDNLGVLNQLTD